MTASCLTALVLLTAATPASATDPAKQQEQLRRQRKSVQTQLDLAKASDSKLEAEVQRLDGAVRRQQNRVDDAKRDSVVASARLAEAARQAAEIDTRARAARQALVANAVKTYMGTAGDQTARLSPASTPGDAARREMYLALFQSRANDLLDELRATLKDLAAATEALERAEADAVKRVDAARREAELLATARTSRAKSQDALKARIAELLEESRQLAAQEAQIRAILQRASRSNGGVSKAGLIWPLGGAVTSEFGPRWGLFHSGIDIAAPAGSAIKAAKAGSVVFAGYNGGYGNLVLIDHGGGIATAYAHMSSFAMRDGQRVSQGQTVGTVGSTGHSTGPHLHFEVRIDGVAKNPRAYLP